MLGFWKDWKWCGRKELRIVPAKEELVTNLRAWRGNVAAGVDGGPGSAQFWGR